MLWMMKLSLYGKVSSTPCMKKMKDQLDNLGKLSSSGLRRNSVGNVACDKLLALEPEGSRNLIAQQGVIPT